MYSSDSFPLISYLNRPYSPLCHRIAFLFFLCQINELCGFDHRHDFVFRTDQIGIVLERLCLTDPGLQDIVNI